MGTIDGEEVFCDPTAQIIRTVERLRGEGFVIEMDDFGSGYSSLNMLSTLPIDALKLDMQFIRNAFSAGKNTRMLEVVFDIAEALGVPTIAEGVETAEQLLTLKAMGCDIVQGYYFSKPLPAGEYAALLKARAGLKVEAAPRKKRVKIDYDALHDPETGIYNRVGFEMLMRDADKHNAALLILRLANYDKLGGDERSDAAKRVSCLLKNTSARWILSAAWAGTNS